MGGKCIDWLIVQGACEGTCRMARRAGRREERCTAEGNLPVASAVRVRTMDVFTFFADVTLLLDQVLNADVVRVRTVALAWVCIGVRVRAAQRTGRLTAVERLAGMVERYVVLTSPMTVHQEDLLTHYDQQVQCRGECCLGAVSSTGGDAGVVQVVRMPVGARQNAVAL